MNAIIFIIFSSYPIINQSIEDLNYQGANINALSVLSSFEFPLNRVYIHSTRTSRFIYMTFVN